MGKRKEPPPEPEAEADPLLAGIEQQQVPHAHAARKKAKKAGGDASGAGRAAAQNDDGAADDDDDGHVAAGADPAFAARAEQRGAGAKKGKSAPVLAWMRVPVTLEGGTGVDVHAVRGMDPRLAAALVEGGFSTLFPVQAAVWNETGGGASAAHDVCVCAPTGSGKTLAYALPLVAGLAGHASGRLRALVVLPTRDLAAQVFAVFALLCPAVGLSVGLAAGRVAAPLEEAVLRHSDAGAVGSAFTGDGAGGNDLSGPSTRAGGDYAAPGVGRDGAGGAAGVDGAGGIGGGCGGGWGVDVLVATPGRLMAHLAGMRGRPLSDLRFLVIDETDRLLRQAYQHWLPAVLAAIQPAAGDDGRAVGAARGLPAPAAAGIGPGGQQRVVKLVLSATLTADPSKIARLGLHAPRYVAMSASDYRYKLPRSLQEYKVLVPGADKALALCVLLAELAGQPTIVFASSVQAAHRLWLLLSGCEGLPERAVEYNSQLSAHQRTVNLKAFAHGTAKVLVASDAMTRGMDVSVVAAVVNYDAPVYAKTYVHRAGRTARAGRSGRVFTLLRSEDMRHFKAMLRKADNTYVMDKKLDAQAMHELRPAVQAALQRMQEVIAAEQDGTRGAAAQPARAS